MKKILIAAVALVFVACDCGSEFVVDISTQEDAAVEMDGGCSGVSDAGEDAGLDSGVDSGTDAGDGHPGKGKHLGWCKGKHNPHCED